MIHILLPFGCLLLDLVGNMLSHQWIFYSTLVYFFLLLLQRPYKEHYGLAGIAFVALLLHDFAIHGQCGLIVLFIIPWIWTMEKMRYTLLHAHLMLCSISIVLFFIVENIVFYRFIEEIPLSWGVTSIKIFINLLIGYVVLWGMQSNRSLVSTKGRKVWTPSRKDAS